MSDVENDYDTITLNIKIDDKTSKVLRISINNDIEKQISSFCDENNINQESKDIIFDAVDKNISKLLKNTEEKIKMARLKSEHNYDEYSSEEEPYYNDDKNSPYKNNYNKYSSKYSTRVKDRQNTRGNSKNKSQNKTKKLKASRSTDNYNNDRGVRRKLDLNKNNRCFILGEEMYQKEKNRKLVKERNIENIKKELAEKEESDCYAIPKINKTSKDMAKKLRANASEVKIEDRLIDQGKKTKQKLLQKMLNKKLEDEKFDKNETFTPNILSNPNCSERNKNILNRSKDDCFENLYKDAEEYKRRKEELSENTMNKICPFKPKITKYAKKDSTNSPKIKILKFDNKEIVVNQLNPVSKAKSAEKEKKAQLPEENRKRQHEIDVYYQKKMFKDKFKDHKNELSNVLEKKQHWLLNTYGFITKVKMMKYKEIFDSLDGDGDGLISYDKISLRNFEKHSINQLFPLINEITKDKLEMITFTEFVSLADRTLYDKIFY